MKDMESQAQPRESHNASSDLPAVRLSFHNCVPSSISIHSTRCRMRQKRRTAQELVRNSTPLGDWRAPLSVRQLYLSTVRPLNIHNSPFPSRRTCRKQRMAKAKKHITLDGRTLEGGGQLLRLAICLSALTSIPVKITRIQGNRPGSGGLKAQHLACVLWLANACHAHVEGAEKGSKELLFEPGQADGEPAEIFLKRDTTRGEVNECQFDIGSAGSTALGLQAILPFLLFSGCVPEDLPILLTLSGGTNVSASPSYEYISQVLLPTLRNLGFPWIQARLGKRGWSHGGLSIGTFGIKIPARKDWRAECELSGFKLLGAPGAGISEPLQPKKLHAAFIAPEACHQHFRTVLLPAVHKHFGPEYAAEDGSHLEITFEDTHHHKRMYFILVATFNSPSDPQDPQGEQRPFILARDWLYDRKICSHDVVAAQLAESVTGALATEWKCEARVDEHMRDQLVVFQALARGKSGVFPGFQKESGEWREPSLHTQTAWWVAEKMLRIEFDERGFCTGAGLGRLRRNDGDEEELEERMKGLEIEG
jgi:RNA 3'-terminal phosphate cyclase (ATP)